MAIFNIITRLLSLLSFYLLWCGCVLAWHRGIPGIIEACVLGLFGLLSCITVFFVSLMKKPSTRERGYQAFFTLFQFVAPLLLLLEHPLHRSHYSWIVTYVIWPLMVLYVVFIIVVAAYTPQGYKEDRKQKSTGQETTA